MRRLLRWEAFDLGPNVEYQPTPKRKSLLNSPRLEPLKIGKSSSSGIGQCAECGGDVKIMVSPRRNPHSSKLGRAVSMKDHDLCRRCWRRLLHQQRQSGILVMPRSMFIGSKKLHPRLLIPKRKSFPREAS